MSDSILNNLMVAAPCNVSWDSMVGDETVRHCGGCQKNVYNISSMSQTQAEKFLRQNGTSPCMRFYRRSDGTIMTDNCPVGLRKLRDRCAKVAAAFAGVVAVTLAMLPVKAQSVRSSAHMGKIAAPSYNSVAGGVAVFHAPVNPGQQTPPDNGVWTAPPRTVPGHTAPNQQAPIQPVSDQPSRGADSAAKQLFDQARASEVSGKLLLAKIQYEDALQSAESNLHSDPKFVQLIRNSLHNVQVRMGTIQATSDKWNPAP